MPDRKGTVRVAVGLGSVVPEQFWAKVNRCGPIPPHAPELGPCWPWTGRTQPRGYGQYGIRSLLTHRVAYTLANGPVPADLVVRHRCDYPPCCNPDHLITGTQADNIRDRDSRGRTAVLRGEENPQAKLTSGAVVAIFELTDHFTNEEVAALVGVHKETVGKVLRGERWADVLIKRSDGSRVTRPFRGLRKESPDA